MNINIDSNEATKLTIYDKHLPRNRKCSIKTESKNKVGRPKKDIIDEPKVARKKPEHYSRKFATYKQIKDYIKEKYGYNIHSAYIAEIKRKYGVDMQATRLIDDAKHVNCPKEKADAIIDALKHFNII